MAPMIFVLLVSATKSVWPNDKALNLLAGPRPWFAPVWAHFCCCCCCYCIIFYTVCGPCLASSFCPLQWVTPLHAYVQNNSDGNGAAKRRKSRLHPLSPANSHDNTYHYLLFMYCNSTGCRREKGEASVYFEKTTQEKIPYPGKDSLLRKRFPTLV